MLYAATHSTLKMTIRKTYYSTLCILLMTLLHQQVNGQEPVKTTGPEKDNRRVASECHLSSAGGTYIHHRVGIIADFKGGSAGWFAYAQRNFDFSHITGSLGDTTRPFRDSIVVRFVVTKEGALCDFTTLGGNRILEEPVFALLRNSPKWFPAKAPTGRDLDAYRTLRVDIEIDYSQKSFTVIPNHVDFYRKND